MKFEVIKILAIRLALSIIVLGIGGGIYHWLTKDSRAIAYYKARLMQPISYTGKADQDALVKLGWLVCRNVHLNHQSIKTNAAMEVFRVSRAMGVKLKEPAFFGVEKADSEKPTEITVWAYREDMPAVEKIIAQFDSTTQ